MLLGDEVLASAMLLFLVMDPLGNVPIFLSVLKDLGDSTRRMVILRELCVALVILLIFLFFGQDILGVLGLQTESVRIAGGVILFIIALRMIFPNSEGLIGTSDEEPFIVPLAIPLLAGPSTLATLIVMSSSSMAWGAQIFALLIAWAGAAAILLCAPLLYKLLRKKGLAAMERLMGMILVMIAVQMLVDGGRSLGLF